MAIVLMKGLEVVTYRRTAAMLSDVKQFEENGIMSYNTIIWSFPFLSNFELLGLAPKNGKVAFISTCFFCCKLCTYLRSRFFILFVI